MLNINLNNRFVILYLLPFVIGSLSVFSFQPYNFILINFIIFPVFFYFIVYINKKSKVTYRKKPYKKNLFIFGLLFGFGFYLSGVSWITNSLTFDQNFKILIPFALIFIPLFLSLFVAFVVLWVGPYLKLNISSIIIFSASLAFSDYLRSKLFTGFPWNLWAYSASWSVELLQILSSVGLYAYNLFLITLFISPVIIFFNIKNIKKLAYLFLIFFIILSSYIYGNYGINRNDKILDKINDKIFVKIISPNFELKYGLNEKEIEERLKKLIRYSEPDKNKETLFIWPEGVFSGYSFDEIQSFKNIFSENFYKNHLIVFGTNKIDSTSGNTYNSMVIVDNNLKIIQRYDKIKLVPFGEFLPFENFLSSIGFKKITEGHGSYSRGNKQKNLKINNISILPLICYEVIFTDFVQKSNADTNLIINISEDGWFGQSIGSEQHFVHSIFRAIESGKYVVRSANNGIAAIVNPLGIVEE